MRFRWPSLCVVLALAGGAITWALTGLPGPPAACLPADCDCEAPGSGPIRQSANAWSSMSLVAAGTLVLVVHPGRRPGETRRRRSPRAGRVPPDLAFSGEDRPAGRRDGLDLTRRLAGGALAGVGLASFLYHAGLTAWAARLDGIAVATLVATAVLYGGTRRYRLLRPSDANRPVVEPPGAPGNTARRRATAIIPWFLLALGALAWWLGGSDGPWCQPEAIVPAHAIWHVLAAAALTLWLRPGRGDAENPRARPPGL